MYFVHIERVTSTERNDLCGILSAIRSITLAWFCHSVGVISIIMSWILRCDQYEKTNLYTLDI